MKSSIRSFLFLLVIVATVQRVVFASTFYECEVQAVVSEVQMGSKDKEVGEGLALRLNIVKTIETKHHDIGCEFESGERHIYLLADSPETLASIDVGKILAIKYSYYSGMGENGPVHSETWTLLSILKI